VDIGKCNDQKNKKYISKYTQLRNEHLIDWLGSRIDVFYGKDDFFTKMYSKSLDGRSKQN